MIRPREDLRFDMARGPSRLGFLLVLAAAAGCNQATKTGPFAAGRDVPTTVANGAAGSEGPLAPDARRLVAESEEDVRPLAEVEPGPYAGDDRFAALSAGFEDRVTTAAARVSAMTGLSFSSGAPPRVVLAALSDERVPHAVSTEIADGRRRTLVRVNAEAVFALGDDLDRALCRAFADAALASRPRRTPLPRWFLVFARAIAAGDLADVHERAVRRAAEEGREPVVRPEDEASADVTGVAAGLLLASRSSPVDLRRLLTLVADGDDPSILLARAIADRNGQWTGAARDALETATDPAWRREGETIRAARRALSEAGPAAMAQAIDARVSTLGPLSETFQTEARALRARAAVVSGEGDLARRIARTMPPGGPTSARLQDPGEYVLDAARAEDLPGGDRSAAFLLYDRFSRDFPSRSEKEEADGAALRLLEAAPPARASEVIERLASSTTMVLDTGQAKFVLGVLVSGHRPAAARRVLGAIGVRAGDPDLDAAKAALAAEEAGPTAAAIEVHRNRVAAWLDKRDAATERDVLDGGAAGANALAERLPSLGDPRRQEAIRLLVKAAGPGQAISLLAARWRSSLAEFGPDLDVLAAEMDYRTLSDSVQAALPAVLTDAGPEAQWERVTFGLNPAWLDSYPRALTRLKSARYAERRSAFDEVVAAGLADSTPRFLTAFARDPAMLLRRQAVLVAGKGGPLSVVLDAFSDAHWAVRKAACASAAERGAKEALPALVSLLETPDPDPRVRAAAAEALLDLGRDDGAAVRALVIAARVEAPDLASGIAARLPSLSPALLLPALVGALRREAERSDAPPDRAVLFRLFLAYRRATGSDPGYDPTLPNDRVRAIIEGLSSRADGEAAPRPH